MTADTCPCGDDLIACQDCGDEHCGDLACMPRDCAAEEMRWIRGDEERAARKEGGL